MRSLELEVTHEEIDVIEGMIETWVQEYERSAHMITTKYMLILAHQQAVLPARTITTSHLPIDDTRTSTYTVLPPTNRSALGLMGFRHGALLRPSPSPSSEESSPAISEPRQLCPAAHADADSLARI